MYDAIQRSIMQYGGKNEKYEQYQERGMARSKRENMQGREWIGKGPTFWGILFRRLWSPMEKGELPLCTKEHRPCTLPKLYIFLVS